jgi:HK97 family phage portal protein
VNTFNLEAKRHTSRVLDTFVQSRPGAAARMGVSNAAVYPVVSSDNDAMKELFQPITSASGFAVTDKTATAVSAVYACLARKSGAITQLPLSIYRHAADGDREAVNGDPLWWLLNESPHALWTAASWKEWIVYCVELRGDQHTQILRGSNRSGGEIVGLKPLHPDLVVPRHVLAESGVRLVYDTVDPYSGRVETIDQDDMLHFAGYGFDGLRSLSAIKHAAKQAIGNSLAASEYMGRTMGEGAMPQIALEYANKLAPEQARILRDNFVATYSGVGNRKLPLVLTEGGKVNAISISPVDLELIAARELEKTNICEAMGVPGILIGDSTKVSSWGTGIEQITLGFVKYTIKPVCVRWREEMNRKLYRRAGKFLDFELDGLLSGDSKAQGEFFKGALGGPGTGDGYMTPNEVRRIKNLPRKEGGDELFKAQRGTTAPTTKTGATQ